MVYSQNGVKYSQNKIMGIRKTSVTWNNFSGKQFSEKIKIQITV